jgi:hypothetical protein
MRSLPRVAIEPSAPALILGGAALVILAGAVGGGTVLLAAITAVVASYMVLRPSLVLWTLLVAVIVLEDDKLGFLPFTADFYSGRVIPTDGLFVLLVAAVAINLGRHRVRPQLPTPFTAPLLVLLVLVLGGAVTGHYGGATIGEIAAELRTFLALVALPFLFVNVREARGGTRKLLLAALALAVFKAVEGLIGFALGQGHPIGGGVLTYINPVPNWLLMLLILTCLAAFLEGARIPLWTKLAAPFAAAALVLAFRRSFYIAGAFGLVMVFVSARATRGRRPAVAIGLAAIAIALGGLFGSGSGGAVTHRALSLNPASVQASTEDRYRVGERKNVMWEVKRRPVVGLGLGVPWTAHYPLSFEYQNNRHYTHIVALAWWLKLGILGVLVYAWLMATALWTAFVVWRRHPDRLVRAASLALFAGFLSLLFMEATQSFSGVELRFTIVEAATFGWLAIARRACRPAERPSAAVEVPPQRPMAPVPVRVGID